MINLKLGGSLTIKSICFNKNLHFNHTNQRSSYGTLHVYLKDNNFEDFDLHHAHKYYIYLLKKGIKLEKEVCKQYERLVHNNHIECKK